MTVIYTMFSTVLSDQDCNFLSLRGYPIGEHSVRDIVEIQWLNDDVGFKLDLLQFLLIQKWSSCGCQVINYYFHMLLESNSLAVREVCT